MPVDMLFNRIIRVLMVSVLWISAPVSGHQDPEIAGYIEVDGGQIWYRLNGSQIFIVPGAGHSAMREDEALYLQTVRAFLAERLIRQ